MGDTRKIRKKYETPFHPWVKSRIEEEKRLSREFGTKNKKELWKTESVLRKFKKQAKKLISLSSNQAALETEQLFRRVKELGLVEGEVSYDIILGLSVDSILSRRLQSVVFKKGLAKTVKQARQFITHEHVAIDGKVITSPSYLVTLKEESVLDFKPSSSLFSEDHAERASPEVLAAKKLEVEAAAKKAAEEAKKAAEAKEAEEKAAEEAAEKEATSEDASEEKSEEASEEKAEEKAETSEEAK